MASPTLLIATFRKPTPPATPSPLSDRACRPPVNHPYTGASSWSPESPVSTTFFSADFVEIATILIFVA